MKQFRLLGMALLALIMSVGFVACSSSDDDDNNGGSSITSGKKLIRITDTGDDGSIHEFWSYIYDKNGKLIKATNNDGGYTWSIDVSWQNNSLIVTSTSDDYYSQENPCKITLKDGKITNATRDNETTNVTYFGNYITKNGNIEYTWQNGNIAKIKVLNSQQTVTCTYYTDKLNMHSTWDIYNLYLYQSLPISVEFGNLLLTAHPNLLGANNKNLLKSITNTYNGNSKTTSYTYELDKDGYPTTISSYDEFGLNSRYILTWE